MSDMEKKVVTEEDLLKSLEKLEGTKEEKKVEETIKTESLKKTAADAIEGNKGLMKSLEVSDFLKVFAGEIGLHVDESLTVLHKSIEDGAKRELAIVRVLEKLSKSLDDLREEVKTFGKTPATVQKSRVVADGGTIIQKSGEIQKSDTPNRKTVTFGLEKLAKSAKPGTSDFHKFTQAAVKFESTSEISDEMLREALLAATGK